MALKAHHPFLVVFKLVLPKLAKLYHGRKNFKSVNNYYLHFRPNGGDIPKM